MSSNATMTSLTEQQRREIFNNVVRVIDRHLYLPSDPPPDLRRFRDEHETPAIEASDVAQFETVMQRALASVARHHIGLFHRRRARTAATVALAVTMVPTTTDADGARWRLTFVDPTGPAGQAGLMRGDLLLTIDGQDIVAPQRPSITRGRSYTVTVRRSNGLTIETLIALPEIASRRKAPPAVAPAKPVTAAKLDAATGLLHVSTFPGVVGVDVARDISRTIADLSCRNLIIDLRGCNGGGMGSLRLMSHLCADRRGVGYNVSRALLERGHVKEQLPRVGKIPRTKFGLVPLTARYLYWKLTRQADAIALFTEGLGAAPHHGRTVVLIDEYAVSSAEMVAAFVAENHLATLVGTPTPGRLVSTSIKDVGCEYRLAYPSGGYMTWHGRMLTPGHGVVPDVVVPLDPDSVLTTEDNQLARARRLLADSH